MTLEKKIFDRAKEIQDKLIKHRRQFHENPEIEFNLTKTLDYVEKNLKEIGYEPERCGKAGIVATVGNGNGKVFLIRGDMDALPIVEETELDYKSKNENMHACGHDFHTSMMLGAAEILKENEEEIEGTVKLMFQPAEETLTGAKDMIDNGLLENPDVDAAMMMHVVTGIPVESGKVIVPSSGVISSASDWYTIKIKGKGGHGATPELAVDPINIAVHTYLSLQSIVSREIAASDEVVLTTGKIESGNTANVIPDTATMSGTLRTFDKETRNFVKNRMEEIVESTAKSLRGEGKVIFGDGCPSVINDENLVEFGKENFKNILGEENVLIADDIMPGEKMSGSEDFGYLSEKVPTLMLALTAGNSKEGHIHSNHHPKVTFDEKALYSGAAIYAYGAMKWLKDNK